MTYSIKALQSNDFEKQRRKRRFNFCFSKTGKTDAQCITFCIWNYFLSSFLREKKSWKLLYQMKKYMKKTTMKEFTISWFSKSCFSPWIITITSNNILLTRNHYGVWNCDTRSRSTIKIFCYMQVWQLHMCRVFFVYWWSIWVF